jgi:hypothetical protein
MVQIISTPLSYYPLTQFRREETKTSSLRFEHIVQEQKAENEQLRIRADDLAARLASVLADNEQLSREHQDSFHILKHLRSQISLAEHHLNEVFNTVLLVLSLYNLTIFANVRLWCGNKVHEMITVHY